MLIWMKCMVRITPKCPLVQCHKWIWINTYITWGSGAHLYELAGHSNEKVFVLIRKGLRDYTGNRLRLTCDGTCAETWFCLSAKRTSRFKSAGTSVQSTTGSRGVGISGSNVGYTMLRGSVKGTGYLLHSQVSPSVSKTVRHCVPSRFNWTLS